MHNHYFWMQRAIAQAKLAHKLSEVPIGAVLVVSEQLIASGYNSSIKSCDPTSHAEINCIKTAAGRLQNYRFPKDSIIYCTLEPCLMCLGAIIHARIGTIVCGAVDSKSNNLSKLNNLQLTMNHRPKVITGICQQQCQDMLLDFFKQRR